MELLDILEFLTVLAEKKGMSPPYIVGGIPRDKLLKRFNDLGDIDTTSGSVFAALFINGTRIPVVSAILPTSSTNQRVTFALNSNLILHVGDILLFKFQGTVPHNEVIVWNVNIMVQKL